MGNKLERKLLESIKRNIKSDLSLKEISRMDFSEFEKKHIPKIKMKLSGRKLHSMVD